MSSTVWVVARGEYSDYRVVGVFSSQEHAQLIADAINASSGGGFDKATVAARPLDPGVGWICETGEWDTDRGQ
jgi:hypothetical protein